MTSRQLPVICGTARRPMRPILEPIEALGLIACQPRMQRLTRATERENLWNALLAARGITAEESDEAVAAVETYGEVVGEISRTDWYRTVAWRPELIVDVLESAEIGGAQAVSRSLAACGVTFTEHPPPLLHRVA